MVNVKLTSNIFGKSDLSGAYRIGVGTTIADFASSLGIKWDYEALIIVNNQFVERDYALEASDHIYFLTPIVGG